MMVTSKLTDISGPSSVVRLPGLLKVSHGNAQ